MSGNQKQHQSQQTQTTAKTKKTEQQVQNIVNTQQIYAAPETLSSEDVLAAQKQVGNQIVQRALDKDSRRKGLTDGQGNLREDITNEIQKKRGGGSPLPDSVQKEASKKLGRSFSDVRIHTDEKADTLSRAINARAFTIGSDIFFKNGVFSPTSSAGRETLIHELTHVIQQSGSSKRSGAGLLKLGAPDTAMEKEASQMGKKHASAVNSSAAGAVQRQGEEEELQMQEEEEELQMQSEEEELQLQEDEEELQMQPEAGVVQRADPLPEEEMSKKDKRKGVRFDASPVKDMIKNEKRKAVKFDAPPVEGMIKKERRKGVRFDAPPLGSTQSGKTVAPGIAKQVEKFEDLSSNWKSGSTSKDAKKSDLTIGTKKTNQWKPGTPTNESQKSNLTIGTKQTNQWKPGTPSKEAPKSDVKIGGSKSSEIPAPPPLPTKEPASPDKPLSFADELKAKSKQMHTNKQRENLAKLETDRSKKVGERVSEQYKEDQANKPKSTGEKVKGFFKGLGSKAGGALKGLAGKAAGAIGGAIKGQASGLVSEYKSHFLGKSEEKAETGEKDGKAGTAEKAAGAGGGGMSDMVLKMAEEIGVLKAKIAELEKK